jgi:aerobic carbon-monoxide dehydrogenase small subunit
MTQVSLTINGKSIVADIEPRTSLADFLRTPAQACTSVHLGCEHGVCGACTVIINGRICRSCIALLASCDGAEVSTIEGLAGDPIIKDLKEAFRIHHGLQCGFCTPAMLITAREVVLFGVEKSEEAVRVAMNGNICRCTGYSGIVAAILSVLGRRQIGSTID